MRSKVLVYSALLLSLSACDHGDNNDDNGSPEAQVTLKSLDIPKLDDVELDSIGCGFQKKFTERFLSEHVTNLKVVKDSCSTYKKGELIQTPDTESEDLKIPCGQDKCWLYSFEVSDDKRNRLDKFYSILQSGGQSVILLPYGESDDLRFLFLTKTVANSYYDYVTQQWQEAPNLPYILLTLRAAVKEARDVP